ncbi:hypothetical protein D3C81_1359790 [compost metagenome]
MSFQIESSSLESIFSRLINITKHLTYSGCTSTILCHNFYFIITFTQDSFIHVKAMNPAFNRCFPFMLQLLRTRHLTFYQLRYSRNFFNRDLRIVPRKIVRTIIQPRALTAAAVIFDILVQLRHSDRQLVIAQLRMTGT